MWALIIFITVQNNLDVDVVNVRIDQIYEESTCGGRELTETKLLPLQTGNAARWQTAICVKIRG